MRSFHIVHFFPFPLEAFFPDFFFGADFLATFLATFLTPTFLVTDALETDGFLTIFFEAEAFLTDFFCTFLETAALAKKEVNTHVDTEADTSHHWPHQGEQWRGSNLGKRTYPL
jgi:hypothetical protein